MSGIETDSGHVLAVTVADVGSSLDGDHTAGATTLTLSDCADFDDTFGGQLLIDGTGYTYSAVDDEASTVVIDPALVANQDDQTRVTLLDPLTGVAATESIASVTIDGFDPGDALQVQVRNALIPQLPGGVRGLVGESVTLQRDEHGTWELVDVIGKTPIDPSVNEFYEDSYTWTDGTDPWVLSYEPRDHSEHLYWHPQGGAGVYQDGANWTRDVLTVTLIDPDGFIQAGDKFTMEYAILAGGDVAPPPDPPPPPPDPPTVFAPDGPVVLSITPSWGGGIVGSTPQWGDSSDSSFAGMAIRYGTSVPSQRQGGQTSFSAEPSLVVDPAARIAVWYKVLASDLPAGVTVALYSAPLSDKKLLSSPLGDNGLVGDAGYTVVEMFPSGTRTIADWLTEWTGATEDLLLEPTWPAPPKPSATTTHSITVSEVRIAIYYP